VIVYSYNRQVTLAAPFVHVAIQPPESEAIVSDVPALLDPAADLTVIPMRVVEQLRLLPLGEVTVTGFDGQITTAVAYLVQLAIRQLDAGQFKVLASEEEPHVLLGRDVLNRHRVVMDGPELRLEIH
jgi:predicted aspartyl protease